jgi:hypothetical protein
MVSNWMPMVGGNPYQGTRPARGDMGIRQILPPVADSVQFSGKRIGNIRPAIAAVADAQRLFQVDRLEYPRPQLVRDKWEKLNGEWDFAFDDGNRGLAENWQAKQSLDRKINVPYPYQSEKSGINDKTIHPVVWYKRDFEVPADWKKDNWKKQDLLMHFNAVDYKTTVFINGEEAYTNEGGHVPFSVNVAPFLKDGKNQVTLRVEDSQSPEQPRGKQSQGGNSHSIVYYNTTGVWQDVWMEPVSKARIDELKMTASLKTKSIDFEIPIRVAPQAKSVAIEVYKDGQRVAYKEADRGAGGIRTSINLKTVQPWTPETPNLYDIRVQLKDKDQKVLDEIGTYTGFRDIQVKNGQFYPNGKPTFMKMVLDQGYWPESYIAPPSGDALKKDVELIKSFGFNGVRKHQKMEDPRWLYWTDKLGLMVWGEMANALDYTPEAAKKTIAEWERAVQRDYNHPSIVTWVPLNESWGVPKLKEGNAQQYDYLERLVAATRRLDPTRPVVPNDGWELPNDADIIAIHDYSGTSQELKGRYHPKEKKPFGEVAGTSDRKILARDANYNGQPVMLTEMGGFLENREESGIGYAGFSTPEELLAKVRDMMKGILELPFIAGFCYTQLTDVEQEKNGLTKYNREPKVSPDSIKQIFDEVFSKKALEKRRNQQRRLTSINGKK